MQTRTLLLVASFILLSGCLQPSRSTAADESRTGAGVMHLDGAATPSDTWKDAPRDTSLEPSQDGRGNLSSSAAKPGASWSGVYAKSSILGGHVNINQPAKAADSSTDDWTQVFAPEAPFRKEDALHFCGPGDMHVWVYDASAGKLLASTDLTGVPRCA